MPADRPGTVWSSTWVPTASPITGFGADGYAACWVDLDPPATARIQVLADGGAPGIGRRGRVVERTFDGQVVDLFVPDAPDVA